MTTEPLVSLTYNMPKKTVGWVSQTITTSVGTLSLYDQEIVTKTQTYPIDTIFDCSHKPFSDGSCLFYLHTDHGVRTFHVDTDPSRFLETFKQLKSVGS